VRQGGPGHPGDADDVDVEDPGPLGVVVGGDVALGADAGVVDHHVEPAEVARAPRSASTSTVAAPIPLAPPVTSATIPSKSPIPASRRSL
jgi:hypothetical protein